MKIVRPSFEVLYPRTKEEWEKEFKLIEVAGRTAYKSEDKITESSALPFITKIISRGHLAVIEFGNMVVKFITDRGVTHELVRHRLCSFVQESTRYCNCSSEKFGHDITFIKPSGLNAEDTEYLWELGCRGAASSYLSLLNNKVTPQIARSVLPNCVKTEIVVKANFREWRHIFSLRAISKAAHPDMRALMTPLYEKCREVCPEIFNMGDPEK